MVLSALHNSEVSSKDTGREGRKVYVIFLKVIFEEFFFLENLFTVSI